ncbi:MAG TPA: thioredoxin domain-containing protein [Polyangiaceae bacterium]|nr:thioredoxin domain-containing protein [Polyangiaceae bacterium]
MPLTRIAPLFLAALATYQSTCRGSAGAGQAPGASGGDQEVSLPGVETGALTAHEKKEWSTWVSELLAPCANEPVSVAQCVKESRKCAKCLPAARLLAKQVRVGHTRIQAEEAVAARFSADRIKSIEVGDSPSKGPSSAPVTIVEWADFQCPHCRHAAPVLEKLVETHPGKVRLAYKFYPLSAHPQGESAARAAVAAMKQGKFWEMHHALFEHQDALEQRDIEKYAKEIGLDIAKWKADWESEATADRVTRDRKQGDQVTISGTPTVYINGREYDLSKNDMSDDLEDWINLEIELATGASADVPAKAVVPAPSAAKPAVGGGEPGKSPGKK